MTTQTMLTELTEIYDRESQCPYRKPAQIALRQAIRILKALDKLVDLNAMAVSLHARSPQ